MNKNTLVLDKMPDLFWQYVKTNNVSQYFSTDNLLFSENIEVIILRTKSEITKSHFTRFPNLKTVIRAGSGYDNIDIDSALENKVVVQNTPDANVQCAYEHTMSMIFSLTKHHKVMNESVLTNNWKSDIPDNLEISDLRVLVVGLGRIGKRLANTLLSMGAEVKYADPYLENKETIELDEISYHEGLKWCNLVTFHCPLYPKTFHMFNRNSVDLIDEPIYVINVSRGGVVDIDAVRYGIDSNKIISAGIDVLENEPWKYEGWENSTKLLLTPHVGAFTKKAKERLSLDCFDAWNDFNTNGTYRYPVKVWK